MKNLIVLALALASQACTSADHLGTTAAELGLQPSDGTSNHFFWAAYQQEPYIYKGCPDPGPEPWAERATLYAKRGTDKIEVELGTAVDLDIRALSLPEGAKLEPGARGLTITVGDPFVGDPFVWSVLVNNERCSYELHAEIVFE